MKNNITFFPVGNGDLSLIKLKDGTTLIVDCNIRQHTVGSSTPEVYDVKKHLLKEAGRRNGIPYIDAFILTHGDCDHCRGFRVHFYQGDPSNYSSENLKNNEIIIDEMWFSPMIAEEHTNEDEDAYQEEAERRISLHRTNNPAKDLAGNRIKIVGYDGTKDYTDLNHLRAIPGTVVTVFNHRKQDLFSVFIHAPFKEHLASAEKDKNSTSIVFQARFKNNFWEKTFSCLAMFGGDAYHYSWAIILEKTRKYANDVVEQALDWDLFLAPHHCSWSYFNDRPQSENPEPKFTSLEILNYRRAGGRVIASSKKILDDDDNPPHYKAKLQYLEKLDANQNFINTDTHPAEDAPKPIVFEITDDGIVQIDGEQESSRIAAALSVATAGIIKKPWS